jgi:hypothetical protein
MVVVVAVGEGDEEAGIGNALHEREKPLRRDKSSGPLTAPAKRRRRLHPSAPFPGLIV